MKNIRRTFVVVLTCFVTLQLVVVVLVVYSTPQVTRLSLTESANAANSLNFFCSHETCLNLYRPIETDISYRHGTWQVGSDGVGDGFEIVVYSAFYDDRPVPNGRTSIRILGVLSVEVNGNSLLDRNLFCQIWSNRKQTVMPYVVSASSEITGGNHNVTGNRIYGQRLFSCPLPLLDADMWTPTHVSLVVTRRCAKASILLPLSDRRRPPDYSFTSPSSAITWPLQFVVCVEIAYGSVSPRQLVEWFEAYRLFGVERFHIYDGNITDKRTLAVLKYYDRIGVVDLRKLPPSVEDYSFDGVRLASPASYNDCMMRNMYTTRFIVVVDFDEIIVPRLHANYSAMIAHIDRTLGFDISYHTYSFRNAYFFQFYADQPTDFPHMFSLRKRRRSKPTDYLFGAKSFIDPRRCLSVFNHFCWVRSAELETGLPDLGVSIDVDVSVGLSHHYRGVCPFDEPTCRLYDDESVVDDIMLKFSVQLNRSVSRVMREIGIFTPTTTIFRNTRHIKRRRRRRKNPMIAL